MFEVMVRVRLVLPSSGLYWVPNNVAIAGGRFRVRVRIVVRVRVKVRVNVRVRIRTNQC